MTDFVKNNNYGDIYVFGFIKYSKKRVYILFYILTYV